MTPDTHNSYITDEDKQRAMDKQQRLRRNLQIGPPAGFADLGGFFKFLLVLGWIQLAGWAFFAVLFFFVFLAALAA